MLTGSAIILIVDAAESRSLLKDHLSQLGYSFVIEASTMDEAMIKLEESSNSGSPVSLMMWAWNTANNQRSCTLSKYRSSSFLKATPIIMLVNERELTQALVSASPHINGYLVKPCTIEALKNSLPMALAKLA